MSPFQIMGFQGAAHVGQLLGKRGVKLEFILDEGLVVSRNIVPGMRGSPAALWVHRFADLISYFGLILGLHPANERRRHFVTTSLIGWVQA